MHESLKLYGIPLVRKTKDVCSKAKQTQAAMKEEHDLHILLFMDWARITQNNY